MDYKPPQTVKAARRKVHIVYYLSKGGGHLDHPHLIEGYISSAQEGLRLKDVKRWLAVLRGKAMPHSYAWSFKRNYKNGFIWHDLGDNDVIQPLCKNEYVLMGLEIKDTIDVQGKCRCGAVPEKKLGPREGTDQSSHVVDEKETLSTKGSFSDIKNEQECIVPKGVIASKSFRISTPPTEIKSNHHHSLAPPNKFIRGPGHTLSLTTQQLLEEVKKPNRSRSTRSMDCMIQEIREEDEDDYDMEFHTRSGQIVKLSPRPKASRSSDHAGGGRGRLSLTSNVSEVGRDKDYEGVNMDVATQTGDSTRCSTDDQEAEIMVDDINQYEYTIKGSPAVGSARHRLSATSCNIDGATVDKSKAFSVPDLELKAMIMPPQEINICASPALSTASSVATVKSSRFARDQQDLSGSIRGDQHSNRNVAASSNDNTTNNQNNSGGPVLLKHLLRCGTSGVDVIKEIKQEVTSNHGHHQTAEDLSKRSSTHHDTLEDHHESRKYWSCKPGSLMSLNIKSKRLSSSAPSETRSVSGFSEGSSSLYIYSQSGQLLESSSSPLALHDQHHLTPGSKKNHQHQVTATPNRAYMNDINLMRTSPVAPSTAIAAATVSTHQHHHHPHRNHHNSMQLHGAGSTSPGNISICSSATSRRSSMREHEGGDLEEGFREAFRGVMLSGMTDSPRRRSINGDYTIDASTSTSTARRARQPHPPPVSSTIPSPSPSSNAIISLTTIAAPQSRNNDLHQIICSPCVPNISNFTKQAGHIILEDPRPQQMQQKQHQSSSAYNSPANKSVPKSLDSPASLFLERRKHGDSMVTTPSSWRDLLWSPRYSSFHREKEKRRMKP